jgi:hypothetical protein
MAKKSDGERAKMDREVKSDPDIRGSGKGRLGRDDDGRWSRRDDVTKVEREMNGGKDERG